MGWWGVRMQALHLQFERRFSFFPSGLPLSVVAFFLARSPLELPTLRGCHWRLVKRYARVCVSSCVFLYACVYI